MSRILDLILKSTDTWDQALDKVNDGLELFTETLTLSTNSTVDVSSGNGYIVGTLGADYLKANILYGGNSTSNTDLVVLSNVIITNTSILSVNSSIRIGNSAVNSTINSTSYSGTANNSLSLGGTLAASYQLNSTLNANIASYLPLYTGIVNSSSLFTNNLYIGNSTVNSIISSTLINVGGGVNITNSNITVSNSTASSVVANNFFRTIFNDGASNSTILMYNFGGQAIFELGGSASSVIDFKVPYSDDYDQRIIANSSSIRIIGGSSTSAANNILLTDANVGIGTVSPTNRLHIVRPSGVSSLGEIYFSDGGYWTHFNSRTSQGSYNGLVQLGDHTLIYSDGTQNTGSFVIGPWFTGSAGIRITNTGNVGIGISNATSTLHVSGTTNITNATIIGETLTVGNSTVNSTINSTSLKITSIIANSTTGTSGQILVSNGTAIYWSDTAGGGGGGSGLFNTNLTNSTGYLINSTMSSAFTAPSTIGYRYILYSIHVTNIGGANTSVTAELEGGTYANISLATTIPVPKESSVELLKMPKIMQPSDILKMQASDTTALHTTITYEAQQDTKYFGAGIDITTDYTYTDLYTATGNSVIQSILLSNDDGVYDTKARVVWTDGSDNIQGYYCYDLIVPADSTIEILEQAKYLPSGYKLRVYSIGNRLEAIVSGKVI